ncbi:MAG: hypothetical protein QF376_04700, partial [Anaerolineales bacterium]|nr:hypothetical protein [Anaerolineales bacterium]
VGSGMALAFALFAKRNALPYLAFFPLVFSLTSETALDRVQAGARTVVLRYAFVANLFLAPPLVLLLRYWPEFIASFTLSLVPYLAVEILGFMLLLALWVFLISCVRLYKSYVRGQMLGLLKRGAVDAATCALLFMVGFELAVYASFVHPKVNAYSLFLPAVLMAGGVLVVAARRRGQSGMAAVLHASPMRRLITANTGNVFLGAIAWGALWQLARVSPEAFGAHIEVAVSRVLFEFLHPQSSISLLSSAGHSSTLAYLGSVGAEWWGHYRGSRWPELLVVALTLFELLLVRRMRDMRVIFFFMLVGMGLLFFSALRHLFPFYVIYEDLLTVLAVSLCFSFLVGLLRSRIGAAGARLRVAIVFALAVYLAAFSFMSRSAELRGMQVGVAAAGCSSPPSGDTCLCDYFYAGTKYGGTGLKGIIEQQYGTDCMQAVGARAAQGLP